MNQIKNQLYLIGFELLRHISRRISLESEEDEQLAAFLTPIFQYFESLPKPWQQTHFAKLIFFIIINNGCRIDLPFDEGTSLKDWMSYFSQLVKDSESIALHRVHNERKHLNSPFSSGMNMAI